MYMNDILLQMQNTELKLNLKLTLYTVSLHNDVVLCRLTPFVLSPHFSFSEFHIHHCSFFMCKLKFYTRYKIIYFNVCISGIDHLLSQHIAHLFIRDPISLFSEKINQNDECDVDHFEVRFCLSFQCNHLNSKCL